MLEKYLVFAGANRYPFGGWDDYRGSFKTLDAAISYIKALNLDWAHVIELDTSLKVWSYPK